VVKSQIKLRIVSIDMEIDVMLPNDVSKFRNVRTK